MKVLFHKYKDIIFLFLLSVLVPMLWYGFRQDLLIVGTDVGYPFNPVEIAKNRFFSWDNSSNFGISQISWIGTIPYHGTEALLTLLSGSLIIGQQIYVIIWFFLPMLAIYIMVKKLPIFRDKSYMALFAAVLYQFNFFQLQGWRVLWRARFSISIVLPLIFILLTDYLEGKRGLVKTVVLSALVLFIFSGGGAPPVFGALILLILTVIIYYILINLSHSSLFLYLKRGIYFLGLFTAVYYIISSFWIIPYTYYFFSSYSKTLSEMGGAISLLSWADVVHRNASILNLLRLQGLDLFELSERTDYLNFFITNPFLIIGSLIWPVLIFLAIFFSKKTKEKKYILLVIILTIIGLVFSAGSHKPFREFFLFLLTSVPGYTIFRTAFHKFGGLFWFAASILIAFSLSSIVEKVSGYFVRKKIPVRKINILSVSLILLVIFFYHFPIFSNNFFIWNPPWTDLVKAPSYIFSYGKWADNMKKDNQRVLLTPRLDDVWNADIYNWNYFSLQTVPYLLTAKSTLSNNQSNSQNTKILLNSYYDSFLEDSDVWRKLNPLLGIKYFLQRNDAFYDLSKIKSDNPQKYDKRLSEMKEVKLEKEFGQWKIYSLDDKYFTPHFYIPENLFYLNGDTYDFVNNLSLFPFDSHAAYYFAPVNTTSFTPQFDFDSYIILPGNPCCFSFNKTSKSASEEYKSLIDAEGIKTVFFEQNFSWQIPKSGNYKILVRTGRPFTNGNNIEITIDSLQVKKRITEDDRKTEWIDIGEIDLSGGEHFLGVMVDGNPIRVVKAGDIVLVSTAVSPKQAPKIVFQKINNTKYRIHVSNVTSSYNLVFSETFDTNWKLYFDKNQKKQNNDIVASYFDGEIQEYNHTNSLLNKDIFETMFLKNLPESRHTMVNGYANAWLIKPKDTGSKAEYDLIVEYFPQRLFYFGCIITVISLIGCLGYLTFRRRKDIVHIS